jgi:hypothetical protein
VNEASVQPIIEVDRPNIWLLSPPHEQAGIKEKQVENSEQRKGNLTWILKCPRAEGLLWMVDYVG